MFKKTAFLTLALCFSVLAEAQGRPLCFEGLGSGYSESARLKYPGGSTNFSVNNLNNCNIRYELKWDRKGLPDIVQKDGEMTSRGKIEVKIISADSEKTYYFKLYCTEKKPSCICNACIYY